MLGPWPAAWASDVMRKKYRLRSSADLYRVRAEGQSWPHRLMVIAVLSNGLDHSRFGFVVGRRMGNAVQRNLIKRRMRESVRVRIQQGEIATGKDVVFIARRPIQQASFHQVDQAIGLMLCRAGVQTAARQ